MQPRSGAAGEDDPLHLRCSRMRRMQSASDDCQGGSEIPYTAAIFEQSSRELRGRRTRDGYSELLIGTTRAAGPLAAADRAKTAAARSAQVAVPVPDMWNIP